MAHTERALPWLLLLSLVLLGSSTAERDCRVSSFKVKENFNKTRVNLFSPGSVMSCITPLSRLQNLAFSSTSVFTFQSQTVILRNSRSV